MSANSREHFNKIAAEYDGWKRKNWYYYKNLKILYHELIPPGANVLEVGCGTGDILACLNPAKGVGIDISEKMLQIAKKKYGSERNLTFYSAMAETLELDEKFDYIFLSDVIEHVEDVNSMINALKRFCGAGTKLIISMANPLWEAPLMISEKLKLKMPEGPHYRISIRNLNKILKDNRFTVAERGYRALVPFYLPGVSDFLNRYFYKIPVLKNIGFIYFCTAKLDSA